MATGIGRAGWAKKGLPKRRPPGPGRKPSGPMGHKGPRAPRGAEPREDEAGMAGGTASPADAAPEARGGAPQRAAPARAPGKPGIRPAVPTPRLAHASTTPEEMLARLLVRTDTVLVIDKPPGLPVHGGPRGHDSLESWLPHLRLGKKRDPQPAHRLDADTAGCLVLGRTQPSLAALGGLFAGRSVRKTYWAVVRGMPMAASGRIDAPLRKTSTAKTGWRMEIHAEGQTAVTRWRVLGRGDGMAWLELSPETGRTHQLRVHCASQGWPILGDSLYGGGAGPLHLLARAIALPATPPVIEAIEATAEPPEAMRAALIACGWSSEP